MDIYALPSIFEGISISILEAMAAGLPVVATAVGGNPEIIVDNKTGFLVESRNSDDMAQKLVHLVKNQDVRASFAASSVERVNSVFDNQTMVSAYCQLYEA
jgi:glycosyltransferase involved in cell wall biosynthesis